MRRRDAPVPPPKAPGGILVDAGDCGDPRLMRPSQKAVYQCRRDKEGDVAGTKRDYLNKREALKVAIKEAKEKAWERLVDSLDEDPWERPYKRTVGKIRPWTSTPTESMDPQDLEGRLDTLFPRGVRQGQEEARGKGQSPGPDGIPGRAWALTLGEGNLSAATRDVLEKCLKEGVFLHEWRRAKLVLLPKESKTPGGAPAFRPICLLDEADKMLERIIADHLVQHVSLEGSDLHSNQDRDLAYSGRGGVQG
ncbi:uncharacterized protein LOC112590578 [Harpegnathos saltator]|uniref:uncharacterized protein LOC112590578 n=1 Tax=Harpegnathos saltator TaxID=610380 RepID=UPI000DBECEF4|nr:uncharacterized protein LOC112590578 [Harpegnathos saltator]